MTVRAPKQGGEGYASLLAELKERIRTARLKAAVAVNEELILLYWSIGRDILDRQTAAGWGARNRATGCCTIALGPRHQARREREEPRATNLVRPTSC